MKKIILILITTFLATNVYAHSTKGHTPNLDYKQQNVQKKISAKFYFKT